MVRSAICSAAAVRSGLPRMGWIRWGGLGVTLTVLTLAAAPAQALESVSFRDLTNISICADQGIECNIHYIDRDNTGLGPYDEIQYQVTQPGDLEPDEIELGFRSILDWAKEIRVVDAEGRQIVMMEAEDGDSRLRRTRLRAADLEGAKLVFVKGRMFGVRRPTFEMPLTEDTLSKLSGKRLTLTWVRD
jgi:hypothetical protein